MMRQVWAAIPSVLFTTTALSTVSLAQGVDEIVVRGANIPDEKRTTSEISNILDETKFERQGDSDIASALQRVTGLSLSEGKFIYVRGLNERYSSATINGSPIPSPEPLRRVAPLDLFPTAVLSGTLVQKTFSPELSGEFGGGTIDLRTKAIPNERFFTIEGSLGANTEATLNDGLLYEGGDRDWTGFDDGTRNTPAAVGALFDVRTVNDFVFEDPDRVAAGSSLDNFDTLVLQRGDIDPNFGLKAAFGDRYDVSDAVSVGFIGALGYDNSWEFREGRSLSNIQSDGGELVEVDPSFFESTENKISTNAYGSFGVDILDNHEIKVLGLIVRKTSKEGRSTERYETSNEGFFRTDNTEWIERQIWTSQLQGEHVFPDLFELEANWRLSYSEASRDAPYERSTRYEGPEFETIGVPTSPLTLDATGVDGASISFSKVEDTYQDAGVDFKLPLFFGNRDFEIKFGGSYNDNERVSSERRYFYSERDIRSCFDNDTPPGSLEQQRADVLLSNAFLQPGVCGGTQPGYSFDQVPNTIVQPGDSIGTLEVLAGYVGVDAQINNFIRAAVGVRYEDGEQVTTPLYANQTVFQDFTIEEEYFLPAATVTWNFADNLQLRVGYSETITRPQFRELSLAEFRNVDTEQNFRGNPFLQNAEIMNIDARLEWYFGREQFLTIGAFYKDLENPIEEITEPGSSGENFRTTFVNAPAAELYGIEAEFEQTFSLFDFVKSGKFGLSQDSFIGEWLSSKDMFLGVNYTYTSSEITADDTQLLLPSTALTTQLTEIPLRPQSTASELLVDGRQLQGQSEHLANLQIGYEDLDANSRATLLVNYTSDRIRAAGTIFGNNESQPDIIEELPITLDFVYSRSFEAWGGDYELGLKAGNILGQGYEASLDGEDIIWQSYDLGRDFSISLKRSF